ncbi:MAG TPA: hypothetical protein VK988_18200 [Acidimicrobiales bacterium]|nr:hypothetical protein [Acidimicrobiales bacterium]
MSTAPWRRRRCGWVAGSLLATSLIASASCGSPKYHYVKNSSERTYVRVPHDWALFDEEEITKRLDQSREAKEAYNRLTWSVGFDAAPRPSLDNILSPKADHPTGLVQVRTLSPEERDEFSLASLRSLLLEFDPLGERGTSGVEVLGSRDVDRPGGLHGNEFVVNLRTTEGTRVKWHQIALVDSAVRKVHVLAISCEDDCYTANEKVIDQVISSWQVKER